MNLKLKRIDPLQAGKILGALYGLISPVFVPFMMVFMLLGNIATRHQGNATPMPLMFGLGVGFMIFLPVLYAAMGFIGGVISAWIYNQLARWIGGLEVEFEQMAPPPIQQTQAPAS